MYRDRTTKAVVRLLTAADHFNRLAKQASRPYRRGFYRKKDRMLEEAICLGAEQFLVDSLLRDGKLTLGLTHMESGRRVHLRPDTMGVEAQVILHRLAVQSGHEYPHPGRRDDVRIREPNTMAHEMAHELTEVIHHG